MKKMQYQDQNGNWIDVNNPKILEQVFDRKLEKALEDKGGETNASSAVFIDGRLTGKTLLENDDRPAYIEFFVNEKFDINKCRTGEQSVYVRLFDDAEAYITIPLFVGGVQDSFNYLYLSFGGGIYRSYAAPIASEEIWTNLDFEKLNLIGGGSSYQLPIAASTRLGGIKTGYLTNGQNYKVQVDNSGNAYVNVPTPTSVANATNAETASSADKLTNVRTLWGQNFNGGTNVSGNISNTGNILPNLTTSYRTLGDGDHRYNKLYLGGNNNGIELATTATKSFESVIKSGGISISSSYDSNTNVGSGIIISGNGGNSGVYMKWIRTDVNSSAWENANLAMYLSTTISNCQTPAAFVMEGSDTIITKRLAIGTNAFDSGNKYTLRVQGDMVANSIAGTISSDLRLKENIEEKDYIEKILSLGEVVDYNYTKEAIETHELLDDKRHTGLIYQNVKDVDIPNLSDVDDDGHGFVNYYSPDLIATMLGAIRQLAKKVKELEKEVSKLEK